MFESRHSDCIEENAAFSGVSPEDAVFLLEIVRKWNFDIGAIFVQDPYTVHFCTDPFLAQEHVLCHNKDVSQIIKAQRRNDLAGI